MEGSQDVSGGAETPAPPGGGGGRLPGNAGGNVAVPPQESKEPQPPPAGSHPQAPGRAEPAPVEPREVEVAQAGRPQGPEQPQEVTETPPQRRPRIKNWMLLLLIGALCIAASIVLTRGATRPDVAYQQVTFTTEGLEENPVTISGLLMKPAKPLEGKRPGVVFAHGLTGSKEWYIQATRPLVQEGFVVLSLDLRGHGSSGGFCTFGNGAAIEMWAAAQYLAQNVPEVDPNNIVAMGHSLGGIASTRSGALQPDRRLSAVVAVYCWTSMKDAVEDLLGPIDDFVGRGWRFTTFSKHIDVNAPDFEQKYSVIDIVDDARPPDYLIAVGNADELVSMEREEQLFEKVTVAARQTGPEKKVKRNLTYGDFASGTARRLAVTGDDHVTELAGGVIALEAINWIKQSAGIPVDPEARAPFLWMRILGLLLLTLGMMLLCMGTLSLVRFRIFTGATGELEVEPPWGGFGDQGIWEVLLYAVAVLAASYLSLPLANAFGIGPFIPYAGVNEISIFSIARTIVVAPVLISLLVMVGTRIGLGSILKEKLKDRLICWAKSLGYAIIPVAVVVLAMTILGKPLLLPRAFAKYPAYFFIGVICICAGFWAEDYLFYKLAYPAFEKRGPGKQQGLTVMVHGLVLDLILVAAFLPIMKGLGVTFTFQAFKIPVVLLMILVTPAFMFAAWVSLRLRTMTGSSMAYSLMFTAILVWLLTGPVGVRGF